MTIDLNDWLRTTVGPVLQEHGYRGGPRRFHRRAGNICSVIQVQGAAGNVVEGQCRFVVNLGVWSKTLAEADPSEPGAMGCPPALDCHICFRLGELGGERAEVWWDIGQGSDRDEVRGQLIEALKSEAFPFLDASGTDDGFRKFWERHGGTLAAYYLGLLDEAQVTLTHTD